MAGLVKYMLICSDTDDVSVRRVSSVHDGVAPFTDEDWETTDIFKEWRDPV